MELPIYLDHHATTPVDPRVLEAMRPAFTEMFGNAASREHLYGWQAEEAVEVARERVAELVGATAREIVFTSGATESINLALKGVAAAYAARGDHVVTAVTEHRAALDCLAALERRGLKVTRVPVGADGRVDPDDIARALGERTVLVSIMLANNEIGVLHPLAEIGRLTRERGVLLHCDAAQAVGKVPVDVDRLAVDLLSISGHKIYGPKGIGALYVRRRAPRVRLDPLIHGGGHERGLRSGTLNVPGIVGLGAACRIAGEEMPEEAPRLLALREELRGRLERELEGVQVNGSCEHRLAGNLNVSFQGVDGEALLLNLRELAVSSGAACTSAEPGPSHVLAALGVPERLARATLRFGIGRFNTREEIAKAADLVIARVPALREGFQHAGA